MKLTVAELRELMVVPQSSWSAALREHCDALERAGDIKGIGETCLALHRSSEYLKLWLARAASEVSVQPPTTTTTMPASSISNTQEVDQ